MQIMVECSVSGAVLRKRCQMDCRQLGIIWMCKNIGLITFAGLGYGLDLDSNPNGYIILCKKVQIYRTLIPTPYFSRVQESEAGSVIRPCVIDNSC